MTLNISFLFYYFYSVPKIRMRFNPEKNLFFASLTVTSTEFDKIRCFWILDALRYLDGIQCFSIPQRRRSVSNSVKVTVKLTKKKKTDFLRIEIQGIFGPK